MFRDSCWYDLMCFYGNDAHHSNPMCREFIQPSFAANYYLQSVYYFIGLLFCRHFPSVSTVTSAIFKWLPTELSASVLGPVWMQARLTGSCSFKLEIDMGSRARHWAHMQKKKFPVEVKIFDQVFLYYTKMSIAVHMCVSLKWAHFCQVWHRKQGTKTFSTH